MRFSDERDLFAAASVLSQAAPSPAVQPGLRTYWRLVAENRWFILLAVLLALMIGAVATVATPPTYEANLLIQIADSAGPPKSVLGDAANVFDIKTPASAEMEIMRSRMVATPAVDSSNLLVVARPRYFPILSGSPTAQPDTVSKDGTFGSIRRWLAGGRSISVRRFEVPAAWNGEPFILTLGEGGSYTLRHASLPTPLEGKVGALLTGAIGNGQLSLLVSDLQGPKGAEFTVTRRSRTKATENLQSALQLSERGRQSGIIEASFRDTDPVRAVAVLNAIGANYVKQSVDRKSAEAEKAIAFLNTQLPALKEQMDRAESAYNGFRSRAGTVSFDDDAKIALERRYDLKAKLAEAEQKKRDLLSNFGGQHPAVKVIDEQIAAIQQDIRGLQAKISAIPRSEQDAHRLERDVKISSDLYQQFRTTSLHLQLVREGLTGNARIIDSAVLPEEAVLPKPAIMLPAAAACGLVFSLLFIFVRSGLATGVRSAREIESGTGLSVYSSAISLSARAGRTLRGRPREVLAVSAPSDEAALGLRQLRALLQHQLRGRANNRLMFTGPTHGVGVHFIASNLAAIMATAGQRVLLIDLDRQRLHRSFGMGNAPGLTELVSGACTRKEAIRATEIAGLDLVEAGSASLQFDQLARSQAFVDLLNHASKDYDIVLLAAPPVLKSSETLSLALEAATVVLVARARKTEVDEIAQSSRRLNQAGQLLSGVVLNGV